MARSLFQATTLFNNDTVILVVVVVVLMARVAEVNKAGFTVLRIARLFVSRKYKHLLSSHEHISIYIVANYRLCPRSVAT